jgi:hypothetical protein
VVVISGVAASNDHVDIEFALRNANLDSCKEALPALCSSDDDEDDNEDDRGHEKQSNVHLSNHLNITGVVSGQVSCGRDSIPPECSRQGGRSRMQRRKVI